MYTLILNYFIGPKDGTRLMIHEVFTYDTITEAVMKVQSLIDQGIEMDKYNYGIYETHGDELVELKLAA